MTGPDGTTPEPTREQEVVEQPTVSTAPPPARPRRRWSAIPTHLGRARTSTVVIGVLFVALFALYLQVRPDTEGTATTGGDTAVTEPATTTGGTPATTPATTPAPTTTAPTSTTEETTPTTSTPTTESTPPSGTTSEPPTTTGSTPGVPLPTTASPTG